MPQIKPSAVLAALCGAAVLTVSAGCGKDTTLHARGSGTLGLSSDDALLYAADADNGIVAVVDTAREEKVAEVRVGSHPDALLVGPDDRIWVANRGSASLSHFRRGEWHEVDTVPVGAEPVGLALSPDAGTLYVVNAASWEDANHGSLMAVDTKTLEVLWESRLPRDPRSIALLSAKRAVISLYRGGDVIEVDLEARRVVREGTDLHTQMHRRDLTAEEASVMPPPPRGSQAPRVHARGMSQVVVSPDGTRVYAPVTWSSDVILNPKIDAVIGGDLGNIYGGGQLTPCGRGGAVATSGIVTFEASRELAAQVDSVRGCEEPAPDRPPTLLTSSPQDRLVQGPTAMLLDSSGSWMFVAHRETDNVAVVPARGPGSFGQGEILMDGMRDVVGVGAGPTGLALTNDGKTLWVHNALDHTVQRLGSRGDTSVKPLSAPIRIAEEVLPADVVAGRKLFFSATDRSINSVGLSCGSCHLEGHEDGHVWKFAEGPRQTPSLAGRMLSQTAPFHWGGEHADFTSFVSHTVGERMGGSGLTALQQGQLLAFIDAMPAPPNPHQKASPTEAQIRGAQVFQKAECSSCHMGEALADTKTWDVGTYVWNGDAPDDVHGFFAQTGGLNTPSLRGLARTAPYLHDGSAETLEERLLFRKDENLHGKTRDLSDAEVGDLVEYLKSL